MEEIGINSPGELEAWLKDKPVEWARVIAHRAAMRVLPLVAEEWKSDRPFERKQALTLALFRANLVARAACYRPNVEMEPFLRASADLADAAHDALAVAYAAAFAAISAFESVSAKAAIQAVDAATFQVSDAAVLWRAVSMDAQWLAAIGKPTQNNFRNLLHEKLWLSRDSAWGVYNLRELRIALMENLEIDDLKGGKIGGWAPLLNWYRQVSFFIMPHEGSKFSPELELKIATQSDEWWNRSAAAVNADIARWVEQERRAIADVVIELLTERGQPVQLQEIFDAAREAGLRVKEKSIRDSLSRLVSAGRIERVGVGLYQAVKADSSPAQNLEQRPAAHSFSEQNGKIHATALASSAQTSSFSEDVWAETERKARQTLERLKRTQAPDSVLETVESLLKTLGGGFGDVRPGLLLMQGRSIEALVAAYGAEGARAEMSEEAIQRVFDLYASVEDLKAFFPEIVKLEAERLAQRLASEDYAKARAAAKEIRDFAFMSEIVDETAREALDLPERIIARLDATISAVTDAKVVALTYEKRSQIGAQGLLDTGNFVIATIKAGTKAVASRTGKGALDGLEDGTKKVVSGAVVTGAVLLAMQILGPVAALGLFVSTFSSYKNKLEELVKRADEVKPDVADVPPT